MSSPPRIVQPVKRRSLVDAVVDSLSGAILHDELAAGEALPAERSLAEQLGVRRGALREGLKRLEQAGLVEIRHGGGTFVRDWRRHAGLESLPGLLQGPDGRIDPEVVGAVMEMRSALAPDVARQAARRRTDAQVGRLLALIEAMTGSMALEDGPVRRARLAAQVGELWSELVDASRNIAYRLAYNALLRVAERGGPFVGGALALEQANVDDFAALVLAVRDQDTERAGQWALQITRRGQEAMAEAIESLAGPLGGGDSTHPAPPEEDRP